MQVKELKSEGLFRELEVMVPANDIEKHVEKRLIEVGKTVKMPGFRPGKVPMDMLKKRYGRAVLGEVLESVVNDTTAEVLKEKKFRPAMQPKIEVKEFDAEILLRFAETLPDAGVSRVRLCTRDQNCHGHI